MIVNQDVGTYLSSNAEYAGFGAFIAFSYLSQPSAPPPSGGDDQNKIRVGIVRGAYVSDNPSIGGMF